MFEVMRVNNSLVYLRYSSENELYKKPYFKNNKHIYVIWVCMAQMYALYN